MDSRYSKFLNKSNKYVTSLHLTEFQGPSSVPTPGFFGVSRGVPTFILPYHQIPKYEKSKGISKLPESLINIQDITKVPPTAPNENATLPFQVQQGVSQIGFGTADVSDENSSNDIDLKNFKKVPDKVLEAFQSPSIDVQTVNFKPKEKKIISQIGKGKKNVSLKSKKHLMKFL